MCSSGLALPGELLVEHKFKKCWSELFYYCQKKKKNRVSKCDGKGRMAALGAAGEKLRAILHSYHAQCLFSAPILFWCVFAFTPPFL